MYFWQWHSKCSILTMITETSWMFSYIRCNVLFNPVCPVLYRAIIPSVFLLPLPSYFLLDSIVMPVTSLSQLHCPFFIILFLIITFASDLLYRISITSSSLHASIAKTSATSFPLIPMCAGIHMNDIVIFTLSSLNKMSYISYMQCWGVTSYM